MVAWFLGLEDVLSWLLVEGKCDTITVYMNSISLLRESIRSSLGRNDGTFVELMVVGELLETYIVGKEKVLHKTVNVIEKNTDVEKLVMIIADSE
ncbi:hypothetical protein Tco_0751793 [Tanacetum coccineum]|uniref:Uncharacterized protein n=1 Tax=Tanacetum coccineum TaxID=301880 RepID=A0ABQ4Z7V5_9ASTR